MQTIILLLTLALVPQTVDGQAITKWEPDVVKLELLNQSEAPLDNAILFYGSSSIRLWKTIANDMAPWPVIQRGYGGAKLPDIIHYAPRVIGPFLGESNPRRCKALVVFVANDITGSKNAIEPDASPEEVAQRFKKFHQAIRSQDATVPIFWIEVTPTQSRWQVWGSIHESTKLITSIIGSDPNSHLIATAGAFLGVDGLPRVELFVDDKLHLNQSGYHLWSALIKCQLDANLGAAIPYNIEKQEIKF